MSSLNKNNIRIIKKYTSFDIDINDNNINNNYRVIKSNSHNIDIYNINKNINNIIHPITLNKIPTDNKPVCLTKFNYKNNKIEFFNYYKCNNNNININNYYDNLIMPPISISYTDLLKIYEIDNIDSLYNWINLNIYKYNYYTYERMITSWILVNSDNIKLYINYLSKIFNIILKQEIKSGFKSDKITEDNIDNINISDIINDYINNNDNDYYNFIYNIIKKIYIILYDINSNKT